MEIHKITATSEQVAQHKTGPIVAVAFAGEYPAGSAGNLCAEEMIAYLRSVLTATNAAAIVFDLREFDYTWGDSICGLAWALRENTTSPRPSAIVSSGRTAHALAPLLGPQFILGFFGTRMFGSTPEAVDHLQRALTEGTV